MSPELASAIIASAQRLGIDPVHLGTAISYETAGTFDPWKAGPTTQWGQHRGLIQWGEPQAKQYGVTKDMSITDQMGAVERYLRDRGVQPGMGMMDVYSTINAGRPGLYNRSDANNGGAPGTVADKVNTQMADHEVNARKLLGAGAPVGALATGAAPAPVDPTNPANPTQTAAVAPVPLQEAAPAAPAGGTVGALASALNPAGGQPQPLPVEYLAPQQIQMAQPRLGQSQQIAAAISKMYGIGA